MGERDYQTYAENEIFNYLYNATGNGVVAMPTGTGKSHVIARVARRALQERPNAKIQMLTHVKELIEQNRDRMLDYWPTAPLGIYSAGVGVKQTYMPITFGGIASMRKVVDEFGHIDLVLVDECHLINPNADTMYIEYFTALKKVNPYVRAIGLTATDWRLGQGRLVDPGNFFTDTIVDMTKLHIFNWFIEQGYILKLLPRPTETRLDLSGVGMVGGDYNMSHVQKAIDRTEITRQALQEAMHYGQMRRKWLVFSSGVEHADHICDMLNGMGIPSTVVHRGVPKAERARRLADYRAGKYRACVNNNILTTGFDDPTIDMIIVLRPTASSSLWVQMLGRGTRPYYAPGYDLDTQQGRLLAIANSVKQNCLVLDFAKNTSLLGPINDPLIPRKKGEGGGEAPVKICETKRLKAGYTGCGFYNHASVRTCDNCGAEFDFSVKFGSVASEQALISTGDQEFKWFNVVSTFYSAGVGASGKTYLRVDYWVTNKKKFTDYVHLEQSGFMLHQAKEWWKARASHDPKWGVPPTVNDALKATHYLKQPVRIRVWVNKQPIPEVMNYEYE